MTNKILDALADNDATFTMTPEMVPGQQVRHASTVNQNSPRGTFVKVMTDLAESRPAPQPKPPARMKPTLSEIIEQFTSLQKQLADQVLHNAARRKQRTDARFAAEQAEAAVVAAEDQLASNYGNSSEGSALKALRSAREQVQITRDRLAAAERPPMETTAIIDPRRLRDLRQRVLAGIAEREAAELLALVREALPRSFAAHSWTSNAVPLPEWLARTLAPAVPAKLDLAANLHALGLKYGVEL